MVFDYNINYEEAIRNEETGIVSSIFIEMDGVYEELSECKIKANGNFSCHLTEDGNIIVDNTSLASNIAGSIIITDYKHRFCGNYITVIPIDWYCGEIETTPSYQESDLWSACSLDLLNEDKEVIDEIIIDGYSENKFFYINATDLKGNNTTFTLTANDKLNSYFNVFTDNVKIIALYPKTTFSSDIVDGMLIKVTNNTCSDITKEYQVKTINMATKYEASQFYITEVSQSSIYYNGNREYGTENILWERDNEYVTSVEFYFTENSSLTDNVSGLTEITTKTENDVTYLHYKYTLDYDSAIRIGFSDDFEVVSTSSIYVITSKTDNYLTLSFKKYNTLNGEIIIQDKTEQHLIKINYKFDAAVAESNNILDVVYEDDENYILFDGNVRFSQPFQILSQSKGENSPFIFISATLGDTNYVVQKQANNGIWQTININTWEGSDGLFRLAYDENVDASAYGTLVILQTNTHIIKNINVLHLIRHTLRGHITDNMGHDGKVQIAPVSITTPNKYQFVETTYDENGNFELTAQDGEYVIVLTPNFNELVEDANVKFDKFNSVITDDGEEFVITIPTNGANEDNEDETTHTYGFVANGKFTTVHRFDLDLSEDTTQEYSIIEEKNIDIIPKINGLEHKKYFNPKYGKWMYEGDETMSSITLNYNTSLLKLYCTATKNKETLLVEYGFNGEEKNVIDEIYSTPTLILEFDHSYSNREKEDIVNLYYIGVDGEEHPLNKKLRIKQEGLPLEDYGNININYKYAESDVFSYTQCMVTNFYRIINGELTNVLNSMTINNTFDTASLVDEVDGDVWGRDLDTGNLEDGIYSRYYYYAITVNNASLPRESAYIDIYGISGITTMCIDNEGNVGDVLTSYSNSSTIKPIYFMSNCYKYFYGNTFTPTDKRIEIEYDVKGIIPSSSKQYLIFYENVDVEINEDDEDNEVIYSLSRGYYNNNLEEMELNHEEFTNLSLVYNSGNLWTNTQTTDLDVIYDDSSAHKKIIIQLNDAKMNNNEQVFNYKTNSSMYRYSIGFATTGEFHTQHPNALYSSIYFQDIGIVNDWAYVSGITNNSIYVYTNIPLCGTNDETIVYNSFYLSSGSNINDVATINGETSLKHNPSGVIRVGDEEINVVDNNLSLIELQFSENIPNTPLYLHMDFPQSHLVFALNGASYDHDKLESVRNNNLEIIDL